MKILFVLTLLSFFALALAVAGIARHVREAERTADLESFENAGGRDLQNV